MGPESLVIEHIPEEVVNFLTSTEGLVTGLIGIAVFAVIKKLKGSGKEQRKGSRKQGIDRRPPYQRPGYSGPVPEPKPAKK